MLKYELLIFSLICVLTQSLSAAAFSTEISFDEDAFPTSTASVSGLNSYNVLNDSDGSELATVNGDLDDLYIDFSSVGGGDFEYRTTNSGSFRAGHSLTTSPTVNNSGNRVVNQIELTFGSHLTVTDFSVDASSTNTAGLAWEVTIFELLDASGSTFSPTPTINPYLTHAEINGSPSIGVYVLDLKSTVVGVGSSMTSTGMSNPDQSLGSGLGYLDFQVTLGTEITGIRMTTILEDTRGTGNGSSNLSSSITEFTFSGDILAVPEPTQALLLLSGACLIFIRRNRN